MYNVHLRSCIWTEAFRLVLLRAKTRETIFRAVAIGAIRKYMARREYFETLLGWLWNVLSYLSLWLRHLPLFLPLPLTPKTNQKRYHHTATSGLLPLCFLSYPTFFARSWGIFAKWTPVTSTEYEVQSNTSK